MNFMLHYKVFICVCVCVYSYSFYIPTTLSSHFSSYLNLLLPPKSNNYTLRTAISSSPKAVQILTCSQLSSPCERYTLEFSCTSYLNKKDET